MDNEPIKKHEVLFRQESKRFVSNKRKRLINADVNGSLNILRKVAGEFQYPIEVCSTPLVLTIKISKYHYLTLKFITMKSL